MKSISKILGVLFVAAVLSAVVAKADEKTATTNAAAKTDDLFSDPVIAKGKNVELKRSRLDEAISGFRANARAHGSEISPADMPIIERSTFDHLLQVQLLNAKATDADKAKGKTEAEKRMTFIRQKAPSEDALERQLKSLNMTVPQLQDRLAEEATAEEVLRDKVSVTDDEIKGFYSTNEARFEEPEKVKVAHILISTGNPRGPAMSDDDKKAKKKIADDLLKRAKAGEDFGKLAKEYSDDPGSKDDGGEYPPFPRGTMVKEFEAAAFSMQTNQVSDLVTTVYGYHIIKLINKYPAKKHELSEPEVKDMIKSRLESQKMEEMLPTYYAQLKKDANVEILDKELKTLEETPLDIPKPPSAPPPTAPPTTPPPVAPSPK